MPARHTLLNAFGRFIMGAFHPGVQSTGFSSGATGPARRHVNIGPETPGLQRNADGSLTITLAHEKPQTKKAAANWLPTPQGGFYAMVRFYAPTAPVLNLTYRLPDIEPVTGSR